MQLTVTVPPVVIVGASFGPVGSKSVHYNSTSALVVPLAVPAQGRSLSRPEAASWHQSARAQTLTRPSWETYFWISCFNLGWPRQPRVLLCHKVCHGPISMKQEVKHGRYLC